MTTPDGSVLLPSYNAASLLDRLDGRLRGAAETTTFVAHIDYNARGQRTLAPHGNGTVCEYSYDPLTFRLVSLVTLRGTRRLQDLRYTYDPVGNPTLIRDHAQQRVFFRNQVVDPSASLHLRRALPADRGDRPRAPRPGRPAASPVPPGATDGPASACPSPATAPRWPATSSGTSTTRLATCCAWPTAPPTRRTAAGPATTGTASRACSNPAGTATG